MRPHAEPSIEAQEIAPELADPHTALDACSSFAASLFRLSMWGAMTEVATIDYAPPEKEPPEELTPRQVLHYHMEEAHLRSIEVKELLLKKLKQDKVASPMEILRIVQKYGDNVERAIETASKLAPYYHPKLEAIEVKSEVQHKFVIRAPDQITNVDEWLKQTGAQRLKIEQHVDSQDAKPREGETQEDDITEDEMLTLDPDINNRGPE